MQAVKNQLSFLSSQLVDEIVKLGSLQHVKEGTKILQEDQFIKILPIVVKGLINVSIRFDGRELLLYYIGPAQSCVMSFSAALANKPSKVFAVAEEDSSLLLLPVEKLQQWMIDYPDLNQLFYRQYDLRYTELLNTIQQLFVNKMDQRLLDYLKNKSEATGHVTLKLSHGQIATEMGTAREVVSRVMKKLEIEGKVAQGPTGIKLL